MQAELYHAIIMDHYRFPRNRGQLTDAAVQAQVINHACGDSIQFYAMVQNGVVSTVKFAGTGCVISQAAASLLSEQIRGKSIEYVMSLTADTMRALVGIELGPTRLRCALLALEAVHKGLAGHARST